MAGGKLTPRQKMINLMYLVFIAMLALNMSKEVLSAFGLINEKFETSNNLALTSNEAILADLDVKAQDKPEQYKVPNEIGKKVAAATTTFYKYVESLKGDFTKDVQRDEKGKMPYEAMDNSSKLDESWFSGDGLSAKGKEVVAAVEAYKSAIKSAIGNDPKFKDITAEFNKKFDTGDVVD